MTATAIKKQFDGYLPLLSAKQQALLLEMVKSFLAIDDDTVSLTDEQKKVLDHRRSSSKPGDYIPWSKAKKQLTFKRK